MLFRNIFENNSIMCILDKTLRLMLFAINNFLRIDTILLLLECTYSYHKTRENFSIGQFWYVYSL